MKRRDITLGEMQDECKKYWRNGDFGYCGKCNYMDVCCHYERYCPAQLNLTDPPRFNEAQMAFLRGCYAIGIVGMMRSGDGAKTHFFTEFETIGFMKNKDIPLEVGETLDLAELLGKDGESK